MSLSADDFKAACDSFIHTWKLYLAPGKNEQVWKEIIEPFSLDTARTLVENPDAPLSFRMRTLFVCIIPEIDKRLASHIQWSPHQHIPFALPLFSNSERYPTRDSNLLQANLFDVKKLAQGRYGKKLIEFFVDLLDLLARWEIVGLDESLPRIVSAVYILRLFPLVGRTEREKFLSIYPLWLFSEGFNSLYAWMKADIDEEWKWRLTHHVILAEDHAGISKALRFHIENSFDFAVAFLCSTREIPHYSDELFAHHVRMMLNRKVRRLVPDEFLEEDITRVSQRLLNVGDYKAAQELKDYLKMNAFLQSAI